MTTATTKYTLNYYYSHSYTSGTTANKPTRLGHAYSTIKLIQSDFNNIVILVSYLCLLDQGLSMRDDDPDSRCASRSNLSSE